MPHRSIAPVTVSMALVLLFLMSEGFGFPLAQYIYLVALLGVATAALCGRRGLEHGMRMIGNRFARKDVA